jgi:ComF family protein
LPLPGHEDARCGACLQRAPPWNRVVAALDYRFPTDALVQRFKFRRNLACGEVLAEELEQALTREGAVSTLPDAVVAVPLHRVRHAGRTFNQSELLARRAANALGVPLKARLLLRTRQTHAQSGLDARSRRRNTRGAFHCRCEEAHGLQHVALVDDVMTTGATLDACTRELKRCGVRDVSIWVAARAPPP